MLVVDGQTPMLAVRAADVRRGEPMNGNCVSRLQSAMKSQALSGFALERATHSVPLAIGRSYMPTQQ